MIRFNVSNDKQTKGKIFRRVHVYLGPEEKTFASIHFELTIPSKSFSVGFDVSADCEDILGFRFCVPPVALYASVDSWRIARVIEKAVRSLGEKRPHSWNRSVTIGIHDWALWWRFWADAHYWENTRPKWRDGSWYPFGFPGARVGKERVLDEREIELPLPEGPHKGMARMIFERRRSTRWPWIVRGRRAVGFDFDPRNGHAPLDTGHRRGPIYGFGLFEADSIENAIEQLVADIAKEREENGYRAEAAQ